MWLLSHSVSVLLLFLVIAAVCRWPRLGPAARHALWLLVLLKLLTPPFIAWPWSLPILPLTYSEAVREAPTPQPPPAARREDRPRVRIDSTALMLPPVESNDISMSSAESDATPSDQARPTPHPERSDRALDAAAVVWLSGGLVVAIVQLRWLMRFRRWLVHARPARPWLTSQVEALASHLGVRTPRVAVLPGLGSPLVWAGGRASLLWPEALEKELSPEGCRAVLAHELAHLARRDHWVAWLIFAAGCLWWWHPLFYLVRRRLHREAELACDARVIAILPDARRSYAEALLDVCQRQTKTAALAPALGVLGRRRDLERRLVMIMRANVASRLSPRILVGIGLLGLILLPGWTLGQVNKPSKNAPTEQDKPLQELEHKLQSILKDLEAQKKPTPAIAVDYGFPVLQLAQQPQMRVDLVFDDVSIQQADRDKKLQDIEAKVQALLKEVQALGSSKPTSQGKAAAAPKTTVLDALPSLITNRGQGVTYLNLHNDGIVDLIVTNETSRKPVEVTLSRTTYNLPAAKAEALGKLLQQHVKAAVMETKVEGDTLTVTTTPEMQQGIRQFIALMEGKTQPPQARQPQMR